MTIPIIANLEKLLDGPRDGALLRYSLGNEWFKAGDAARAAIYFRAAVERDPNYSAAWKLLGKTLAESGANDEAIVAYRQGIVVADGGHFGTEFPVVADLCQRLEETAAKKQWNITCETDPTSKDMLQYM